MLNDRDNILTALREKLTAATAPDGTIQPEDAWPSW